MQNSASGSEHSSSDGLANPGSAQRLLDNFTEYIYYAGAGLVVGVALGSALALASLSWSIVICGCIGSTMFVALSP